MEQQAAAMVAGGAELRGGDKGRRVKIKAGRTGGRADGQTAQA